MVTKDRKDLPERLEYVRRRTVVNKISPNPPLEASGDDEDYDETTVSAYQWIDKNSNTTIQYITLTEQKPEQIVHQTTLLDELIGYGYFAVLILIALSCIVRFITILRWIL